MAVPDGLLQNVEWSWAHTREFESLSPSGNSHGNGYLSIYLNCLGLRWWCSYGWRNHSSSPWKNWRYTQCPEYILDASWCWLLYEELWLVLRTSRKLWTSLTLLRSSCGFLLYFFFAYRDYRRVGVLESWPRGSSPTAGNYNEELR